MELGKKVSAAGLIFCLVQSIYCMQRMQVFTSWVNHELSSKKVRISNLETDLSDGSVLISLVEVLLNKHVDVSLILTHKFTMASELIVFKVKICFS